MTVEQLRTICLSLPGTTEDIKWGADLVFMVGGKMFCVTSTEPPHNVSFKVSDEEFEELSIQQGIIPAPYMARAKWIQVQKHSVLNKKEWEEKINRRMHWLQLNLLRSRKPN
jgi:predicted DNA-binding protein (MmcQ/YjbR family)